MVVNLAEKGDIKIKLKQQKREAESHQGGAVHCSEDHRVLAYLRLALILDFGTSCCFLPSHLQPRFYSPLLVWILHLGF